MYWEESENPRWELQPPSLTTRRTSTSTSTTVQYDECNNTRTSTVRFRDGNRIIRVLYYTVFLYYTCIILRAPLAVRIIQFLPL